MFTYPKIAKIDLFGYLIVPTEPTHTVALCYSAYDQSNFHTESNESLDNAHPDEPSPIPEAEKILSIPFVDFEQLLTTLPSKQLSIEFTQQLKACINKKNQVNI